MLSSLPQNRAWARRAKASLLLILGLSVIVGGLGQYESGIFHGGDGEGRERQTRSFVLDQRHLNNVLAK